MTSLLGGFQGKVDLIYLDPLFNVDKDFLVEILWGYHPDESPTSHLSLAITVYRDTWGQANASDLFVIYERFILS